MSLLRISGIEPESIVDGRGFRYVVFTQGCPHHCPGCHNPETHDFAGGRLAEVQSLFEEFCQSPLLRGITFSGGEPFCQPGPLAELARLVHGAGKDVTAFTGYTYEELSQRDDPAVRDLLMQVDTLIDGRFELERRDLTLRFRGSGNQRILDMAKTRERGVPVPDEELMAPV